MRMRGEAPWLALAMAAALCAGRPDSTRPSTPCARDDTAWLLRLNLPAYRLDVVRDSVVVASFDVAIGARKYATPTGRWSIARVVWNPWWIPPPSRWARRDTVTPPGPKNPIGRVKLHLGGALHVHGTPATASIGTPASHACVRMRDEDVRELAARVQEIGGAPMDEAALRAYGEPGAPTDTVELPMPVAMHIVYELAELRGDTLLLHPDVYARAKGGLRPQAMAALGRAGVDTMRVGRARLSRAIVRARRAHVAVPLDSLLAPALAGR